MGFDRVWHQHYPPGVPREVDFQRISLPEALTRSAERFPDKAALLYLGRKISFRELDDLVSRFARALADLGVHRGDKVALALPDIPQAVIAAYAVLRRGAVTVVHDPLQTEGELARQLDDGDASFLVTLDAWCARFPRFREQTKIESVVACHLNEYLPFPRKHLFPLVRPGQYRRVARTDGVYLFSELVDHAPEGPVENAAAWDEMAALLYTSGATGPGKGVVLTHASLSANVQQLRAWLSCLPDGEESVLSAFPLCRPMGWTGVQNLCLDAGWTMILAPRPEPAALAAMLERCRPTVFFAPPAVLADLVQDQRFRSLEAFFLKALVSGGGPLDLQVVQELKAIRNLPLLHVYGLTEMAPFAAATPLGGPEKTGAAGVPLPSTDLKIAEGPDGRRELPVGEVGDIFLRGPQAMKGYYKQPEETARVLQEGWLHTGDRGTLDADGFLTVAGRRKDAAAEGVRGPEPRKTKTPRGKGGGQGSRAPGRSGRGMQPAFREVPGDAPVPGPAPEADDGRRGPGKASGTGLRRRQERGGNRSMSDSRAGYAPAPGCRAGSASAGTAVSFQAGLRGQVSPWG